MKRQKSFDSITESESSQALVDSSSACDGKIRETQLVLAKFDSKRITNDMFQLQFKGKQHEDRKRLHMTPQGQLVAGIRRNLSNIPASDFGCATLTDMSGANMIRAEIVTGACRTYSFRHFHDSMEQQAAQLARNHLVTVTHTYSFFNATAITFLSRFRLSSYSVLVGP